MKLRPGITSFFEGHERDSIPKYSIAEFKHLVHALALLQGSKIGSISECGITPNFHTAELQMEGTRLFVLGHSNFPVIAFVEQLNHDDQQLRFVDNLNVAGEISRLCPEVEIGRTSDLSRLITNDDLAVLTVVEQKQVAYWKPRTIGQLVFNWWD